MGIRALVVVSVGALASVIALAEGPVEVRTFGDRLSGDLPLTPIAEIVADPDAWEGERVQVAGEVTGVCTRQGCWLDVAAPDDATLRVKVEDGVIVFPPDAVGNSAVAEGTVEILDLGRDEYEVWVRHVAEEEGREFDPKEIGEPPYRIVRLRGHGAEITRR